MRYSLDHDVLLTAVPMIACVDVGGTSIKRGRVDGAEVHDLASVTIDALAPQAELIAQLVAAFAGTLGGGTAQKLAIAFPAPFDYELGIPLITGQQKFLSIYGVDLRASIAQGIPHQELDVRFLNDAAAAALGEATHGAGVGSSRVLMITLGTGFGAAVVFDGVASQNVAGYEVGDLYGQRVSDFGLSDELGLADDLLSATGLARAVGVSPSGLARAAQEARASGVHGGFATFGDHLGQLLESLTKALGANRVVVGGGASPAFDLFAPAACRRLSADLVPARLGAHAALIGAAAIFDE